jgi:hypothetical protein
MVIVVGILTLGISELLVEPHIEEVQVETTPGDAQPPLVVEEPPQENPTPGTTTEPPSTFTNEQPVVFVVTGSLEGVPTFQSAKLENGYVFLDTSSTYLDWRFLPSRQSYEHLINSGRQVYYTGSTEHPSTAAFRDAALVAYGAYKVQCWVRLSGFPRSPFADEEYAIQLVKTCLEHGRSWEVALAIAGFESTYGLGSGNVYGILDNRYNDGGPDGYCGFLDFYCGARDELGWIVNCGGYNPSSDYHRNVYNQASNIRGEAY